jgi:hypothetical protein
VEAVGDLHGAGGALPSAVGVGAAPIPADDGGGAVLGEPGREGRGRPVVEQVDRPPALQIDHEGAVPVAPPEGEIVDAEHDRAGHRRGGRRPDQPDQGRAAGADRPPGGEPRPRAAAERHPDVAELAVERYGPPRRPSGERRDLLRERATLAAPAGAPEPPDVQTDCDAPTTDRLIGEPADVAAMNAPRAAPAGRAAGTGPTSRDLQHDLVGQERRLQEPQAAQMTKDGGQTQAHLAHGPCRCGTTGWAKLWSRPGR